MKRTVLLFCGCALLTNLSLANAAGAKVDGLRIHWRESHHEIDLSSVCANFPRQNTHHRDCRREAKQLFIRRCTQLNERINRVGARVSDALRDEREKFCIAASQFAPVD